MPTENENSQKKRSIRLTSEGMECLTRALEDAWRKDPLSGKLTQDKRAVLVDLGVSTANKLFRNRGVDKGSALVAFRALEIEWSEAYVQPDLTIALVRDDVSKLPEQIPEFSTAPPVSRRLWIGVAIGLAILGGVIASMGWIWPPNSQHWQSEFNQRYFRAETLYMDGQYNEARAELEGTIQLAREKNGATQLVTALRLGGDLEAAAGNLEVSAQHYLDCLAFARHLDHPERLPGIHEAVGLSQLRLGNLDIAEPYLTQAYNSWRESDEPHGVAIAGGDLAALALARGQLSEAARLWTEAVALANQTDDDALKNDLSASLALVQLQLQGDRSGLATLERCQQYWDAKDHDRWRAKVRVQRALAYRVIGEDEKAAPYIAEGRRMFLEAGDAAGIQVCDVAANDHVATSHPDLPARFSYDPLYRSRQ